MSDVTGTVARLQVTAGRMQTIGSTGSNTAREPGAGGFDQLLARKLAAAAEFVEQRMAQARQSEAKLLGPGSERRVVQQAVNWPRTIGPVDTNAAIYDVAMPVRRAATAGVAIRPKATSGGSGSFDHLIDKYASHFGVDPALVRAVVQAESNFNPQATSRVGAKGLMQLMDGTARSLGVTDAYDPEQNIRGGVQFLRDLVQKFGDVKLALAGYNAGPEAVRKYGGIPPYDETQAYVRIVMQNYERFKNI